ncbi:MAG TPA: hypothetical protein VFC74_01525 [Oscillospiraceae bacterium]|nr:hypothetical protein [Oscillospiraceae bacterium]
MFYVIEHFHIILPEKQEDLFRIIVIQTRPELNTTTNDVEINGLCSEQAGADGRVMYANGEYETFQEAKNNAIVKEDRNPIQPDSKSAVAAYIVESEHKPKLTSQQSS